MEEWFVIVRGIALGVGILALMLSFFVSRGHGLPWDASSRSRKLFFFGLFTVLFGQLVGGLSRLIT